LAESLVDAPHSALQRLASVPVCPTCGESLPWDARFCPYDGLELADGLDRRSGRNSGTRDLATRRDSLVGLIVDERYEILQLMGEGGMGCVYRVRHRVLGRLFALKVLRPELACDFALAERFVQEARAAAAISHPNVVSITDFGILDRGQPYFVMELLEGRTLSSVLRHRGAFEPEQVALIARSVASALGAAHDVGVIHRDLKPDNVILLGDATDPSSLKVLDFGLAKLLWHGRLTRNDIVYGTPQYMSPEQAAGESIDVRVDVYALGILMYEMLAGRVPFEGDSYMDVLTKQLYAEPPLPSLACPALSQCRGLEAIVLRCLRKEPDARFGRMSEVVEALDALGIGSKGVARSDSVRLWPVSSGRSPINGPTVRSNRQRLRRWAYALVGVAALGSALALLYGRLRGKDSSARTDARLVSVESASDIAGVVQRAAQEPRVGPIAERRAVAVPNRAGLPPASPVTATHNAENRAWNRNPGRPTGQVRRSGSDPADEPTGAVSGSLVGKGTPRSSEIASPWAK
jgi:eukaryotic-like serine/threonine-protein kinase